MKRERQIELIKSAEKRTRGYLREWLKDPAVKAAVHRQDRPKGTMQQRTRLSVANYSKDL